MPLSSVVGAQSIVRPGVCTSTTRPASPYDGQVIYMSDVDQTAVWDGSAWVGIERSRDRNVVINGAMQVHQRGTSTAGIVGNGYYTADRWLTDASALGTWTQSVENDAPTGSGFRKSLKMLCTTANASPSAANYIYISQRIEGQNAQVFAKGTPSTKSMTVSFWVKSNVTGTYVVRLLDQDNSNRMASAQYTISVSATWEKKTITFSGDTTGVFDNDANASLWLSFWIAGGSNFTSGTTQAWGSYTAANEAPGQTNLASATNNYWQVTGVQLEAGAVATPFEFEDYGTTLAKCQRYFQICYSTIGQALSTTAWTTNVAFKTEMRGTPSVAPFGGVINITLNGSADYAQSSTGITIYGSNRIDSRGAIIYYGNFSGISAGTIYLQNTNMGGSASNGAAFSAEL